MSIRGIDNQLMITRATEMVKDSDASLRKNELMQDYLAIQSQIEGEKEKAMVGEALEVQEAEVKLDKDGEGANNYEGQSKKGSQGEIETETDRQFVPREEHKIDIKV